MFAIVRLDKAKTFYTRPTKWFCPLGLSKSLAEFAASRLNQNNLLAADVKITDFRHRSDPYSKFFSLHNENQLVACHDINGLMNTLDIDHKPEEWRLFLDASQSSLKVVLLYNGNTKPSIPLAYSRTMRETYENIKIVLSSIQYEKHDWLICADLKMLAILLGLQSGWTKFCCFHVYGIAAIAPNII